MKDNTLIAMAGTIYATFAVRNNNTRNLHYTNYINRRKNLKFNSKHNLDKSRMITISAENSNHKYNNHIIHTPETDSEFQRGWMKNCEKIRVISRENYKKYLNLLLLVNQNFIITYILDFLKMNEAITIIYFV